jgi:hypothetical protein
MNADRAAIERFVEAFEKRRARQPGALRVWRWLVILVAILLLYCSALDIFADKPIDPLLVFTFLACTAGYGTEKLSAELLVPLAREHLRSTSSNRDAA